MSNDAGQVTQLLAQVRGGDAEALDRLIPILYRDLREIARRQLRKERPGHTLSTTALVNEAYLRLNRQDQIRADDRTEFCAIAGMTMRRVLVDYARSRKRKKRGSGQAPLSLEQAEIEDAAALMTEQQADDLLSLDEALERLAAINRRGCEVVQYRFFAGLTLEETAELMDVSIKTVQRAWLAARAWLRKEVEADLRLE